MANEEAARAFREIAALIELKGESPFQARAYQRAADEIERAGDLVRLAREGRLTELPGIGKGLADKIASFVATGSIPMLGELRKEIPSGVVELSRIPGLGPGRIRTMREAIGVESPEDLGRALEEGNLSGVKGFGPKVLEDLRRAFAYWKGTRALRLHRIAREDADAVLAALLGLGAKEAAIAGDLARWLEVVGDLSLVASHPRPADLLASATGRLPGSRVEGDTLLFTGGSGLPGRLRVVPPPVFGAALALATGAPDHIASLVRLAGERSLVLDENGLRRGEETIPAPDEASFYAHLGLPLLPPEVREGTGEIDLALRGPLPGLLVRGDIRGVVHVHTTWSDGAASIREMAERAAAIGFEYLAIADHSRSAGYAGGLSAERLLAQGEEIRSIEGEMAPFRIFHGVESDILADGTLDYPDETLERLDFVVSSVHSRFGLPREEQTARIAAAVRNRFTTVLGHPSGRLLLSREPYDFDANAVWDAAAKAGTAIELNAHEERLDVDWREIGKLRKRGIPIWIGSDAHAPAEM
ncbi:MAG: helix-hairpin-helix domain-containing protein, partial [Candidatus Eisenbacteria bacterium]